MRIGPILRSRLGLLILAVVVAPGCGTSRPQATEMTSEELPPAYTRDKILDPRLAEIARTFTAWVEMRKAGDARVFLRIEVLPLAPTLLPYGIGTYQKEMRLPVILITGPGWSALTPDEREALAARAFRELTDRLATLDGVPPPRPTLTIQTTQGLELGWINQLEPGGKLLHGVDE